MAEFNKGDRVEVTYGVDTGKQGTVDHETVYVLVDGRGKLKPYLPDHVKAVTPTPTPDPTPTPSGKLLFDGFADNVTGGSAPYQYKPWGLVQELGGKVSIIDAPTPLLKYGKKAFKMETTVASYSNGPRGQLNDAHWVNSGDPDLWILVPFYFQSGQKFTGSHWTIFQFKQEGSGKPIITLDVRDNFPSTGKGGLALQIADQSGQTKFWGGGGNKDGVPLVASTALPGAQEAILHIKPLDTANGLIEVYMNGATSPTCHQQVATMNTGIHSGLQICGYGPGPQSIIATGMRYGTTRDSLFAS